jgi:cholesterol oxidase
LFDEALRFQGFPAEERCHSAVCHRVTFLFSRLYNHANLTQRMHDDLHELFGVANLRGLEQLSSMVRHHGHVVDEHGGNTYLTPENLHRLALPMLFISGGDNQCYHPSSTAKSRDLLATANPNDQYDRVVIPGYGHIDCMFGADAVHDVYPSILAHLDAH